jgi:uncharacterized damage-inducible protein DinB
MRPFGVLALEMITMAVPLVKGIVSEKWDMIQHRDAQPKSEILRLWDESTEELNQLWPQIPPPRFQETMTAFGQWPGVVHDLVLYVIDNEVHHRGQGYVYLRGLGLEPPAFFDRS